VAGIVDEGDVVFSCVDNHATRKLLSDRCEGLDDVVLISGGNDGVEAGHRGTYGNVQVFVRRSGADVTVPLTRFHAEIREPADRVPSASCGQLAATSAPQVLFTNLAAASAMCNAFYRLLLPGEDGLYDEVCFDILEGRSVPHRL
jgi:molybdopterin/thiamine biosynthesis adenylyltransferase